jgi:hypothetical protein
MVKTVRLGEIMKLDSYCYLALIIEFSWDDALYRYRR